MFTDEILKLIEDGKGPDEIKDYLSSMEMVEIEDPVTKEKVKVPKQVDVLLGHKATSIRKGIESTYKNKFEELKNKAGSEVDDAITQKLRELEEEKLPEAERKILQAERNAKEAAARAELLQNTAQENFNKFRNEKIRNDVYSALGTYKLNNAQQVMQLLMLNGQADLVDEGGNYKTVLKMQTESGELEEMDPKSAAERFFAQPENMHHLRENLAAGGGSSQVGARQPDGTIAFTRDQLATPEGRAKKREAQQTGATIRIVN